MASIIPNFFSIQKLDSTQLKPQNTFKIIMKKFKFWFTICHYENTPIQYAAIFKGCKNGNFQMKNCNIFLIFAQNIDCGYTLEPPQ